MEQTARRESGHAVLVRLRMERPSTDIVTSD